MNCVGTSFGVRVKHGALESGVHTRFCLAILFWLVLPVRAFNARCLNGSTVEGAADVFSLAAAVPGKIRPTAGEGF